MISPEKIEEWIREAQERPSSGPLIIRFLANRLAELSKWNEELLSENIQLRSGEKVEKYVSRIANLEYQLDLLKRQFSGEWSPEAEAMPAEPVASFTNLIIYNALGKVIRLELNPEKLEPNQSLGKLPGAELSFSDSAPRLLAASQQEELLFVFDSGRTTTMPLLEIPISNPLKLSWETAFYQEPRGAEELVAIQPIARMSLSDFCLQVSRRGYVKKIKESFFETHVAKDYIGTGVTQKFDRTLDLVLCNPGDLLVLVSKEGYLSTIAIDRLPLTIEEVTRLGSTDHIVSAFIESGKDFLLMITNDGKVIHRDMSWLEPAAPLKAKGKPVFSGRKREAGARIVGAGLTDGTDRAVFLTSAGDLIPQAVSDLFASGSVKIEGLPGIVEFTIIKIPKNG